MNIKQELQNTCWEKYTIDDLNQHKGYIRDIFLTAYQVWLWEQRGKKHKANQLRKQISQYI